MRLLLGILGFEFDGQPLFYADISLGVYDLRSGVELTLNQKPKH